ncbi:hypothetical protein [Helicobacter bizzozeronii]|uniref:hypothetical protein n=1 Tax=Helicobacter bizzozeronii TaxID=56877 RepID=UPI000CF0AFCE|nr:hypothetical protein [Helicobacter bizzozeronii]
MKLTINTAKIIDDFGNISSFAKSYGMPPMTFKYYCSYKRANHFRNINNRDILKKMEADGYITMEYHNGN